MSTNEFIKFSERGYLRCMQQLGVLVLSQKELKEISRLTGRAVMKEVKQNIKAERSPDGTPWVGRSSKSGKKGRILKKMATSKTGNRRLALLSVDTDSVTLGWKNPVTAKIAYGHQHGYHYTVDPFDNETPSPFGEQAKIKTLSDKVEKNKKERKRRVTKRRPPRAERGCYGRPATDRQAKALAKLVGFKWPARGQNSRRRSQSWITENLSFGQAGLILKDCGYLHGDLEFFLGDVNPKKRRAHMPARPFLGVSETVSENIGKEVFEQLKLRIENA